MEQVEIWKDIPNHEGTYQVSNLGRVRSLKFGKEKIMKQVLDKKNYFFLTLMENKKNKTKRVHKLVAMAFLNHIPSKMNYVVDHIDNNSKNNKLDNLQIVTNRYNCQKDKKGYSSKYIGVSWCKHFKKWNSKIRIGNKNKNLGYFKNEVEASIAYKNALKEIL